VLEADRALRRERSIEMVEAWLVALLPALLGLALAAAWWRCGLLPALAAEGAGAGASSDLRSAAARTLGSALDDGLEDDEDAGAGGARGAAPPADAWALAVCGAVASRRALPLGAPLLLALLVASRLGLQALGAALRRLAAAPASAATKKLLAAAAAAPASTTAVAAAAAPTSGALGLVGSALRVVPAALGAYRATTGVLADACALVFVWVLVSAALQALAAA